MALYELTGSGVQALSPGVSRLFVEISALPTGYSTGRANPINLFDVGLLRLGVGVAFGKPIALDAEEMFVDLPSGVDHLGYAVFPGGSIRVNEDTPVPPPGVSLVVTADADPIINGTNVTITWSGIAFGMDDDYLTLMTAAADSGVWDPSQQCFGPGGVLFAATCSSVADGGPAPVSGSCTTTYYALTPSGTLMNARYRRNSGDVDVVVSASFVSG